MTIRARAGRVRHIANSRAVVRTRTRPEEEHVKDRQITDCAGLRRACEARGATITTTRGGHLKITGPAGIATVSPKWGDWRARQNAIADVRRHAGIDVAAPIPAARTASTDAPPPKLVVSGGGRPTLSYSKTAPEPQKEPTMTAARKIAAAPTPPPGPASSIRTVGPELAQMWLDTNTKNRSVSRTAVDRYARDMKTGEWLFTGDAVKFAADGRLLDGQHRLRAVIDAGVEVQMLVVEGLTEQSQTVMDTGRKRTTADALSLLGESNTSNLAAVARMVFTGGGEHRGTEPTTTELLDLITADDDVRVAAEFAYSERSGIPTAAPSAVGYAYWRLTKVDPDDCQKFFQQLVTLSDLPAGSPVLALHKRLLVGAGSRRSSAHALRREQLAWIFSAWNAYRRSQTRAMIKAYTGTDGKVVVPDPV